ncbi:hypothetical protein BDW74DRAFT_184287 [Aspergillus multicolor]|uniref:uncharacterized protein n=1 Tax=Aspergillus multicolor TaxID=41759 RepID=UPI003CCD35FB
MGDAATTVPLTTIFTRPTDCSKSWTYEASPYNSVGAGLLIQNAIKPSMDVICYPPGFNHAERGADDVVFSPGACPFGYTTNNLDVTVEETVTASCCLSGFAYRSNNGKAEQGCVSTFSGTTRVAARAGGLGTSIDFTTSTTVSGTLEMWAQPITIMYQESDLSLYTTTTTNRSSSTTSNATSDTAPNPSDVHTAETETSSSDGLSGGAIAGIAVGCVAGVLVLLGLVFIMWRRKRGKVQSANDQSVPHRNTPGEGYGTKPTGAMSEMSSSGGHTRSELDVNAAAGRGKRRTAELE